MPTILTLDHIDYLLPDGVNINTVVKALEKVQRVRAEYKQGYTYTIEKAW